MVTRVHGFATMVGLLLHAVDAPMLRKRDPDGRAYYYDFAD
jgi:hypothetical protein